MKPPIKVFILGSCVSRDPFVAAGTGDFEIVAYGARTSLASQITPPYVDEKILDKITSPFQKRALRGDMDKTVLKDAIEKDYDVLMMDMIEERHDLSVFGESMHTRCSEYMSGLYEPNPYSVIGKISDEKLLYWKRGFDFLATSLRTKGTINKMVISKAYFTGKTNAPPEEHFSAVC